MAGTIKEIAEKAGVSRGTVDRALNNRGRVNPEVAERIFEIAREMNYQPKRKKKVYNQGKKIRIGVITQLAKSSFVKTIHAGIDKAEQELEEFGVEIIRKQIDGVSEDAQLEALEELSQERIDGLAIMPVQSERIREKLNDMAEQNDLPIITFNSDIVGTNRVCYVGLDNKRSGMTAAGLMGMLTRGTGKVLVITGFFTNSVNNLRVDGFIQELKMSYPEIELLGVQSSFDEMSEVEKIVENTIEIAPDLTGIFVVSGGQAGVCKAMQKLNMETRPYVIGYDVTPTNIKALKEGTYDEVQQVTLTSATGGTIYYTTDGSDPTESSTEYKEAVLLQSEGDTEIRAIAVNKKGIPSAVSSAKYSIEFPLVDAPAVSPSTGQYSTATQITITVPDGYTAYYTMDGSTPTASSEKYTDPIDMPENSQTTFSAILVNDKNGKATGVTTRNYITTY